jgi:hypothetical protein
MPFLLLALLLQAPAISISQDFFKDGERIPLRSTQLSLNFHGFSRADLIEIIPAGRQEDPSVRVASAGIRNLLLVNDDDTYVVQHDTRNRQRDSIVFTPADLRQDTLLLLTVPDGTRLSITYDGIVIQEWGRMKESVFLNDHAIHGAAQGALVRKLNQRLKDAEIVLPVIPPANPKAQMIHSDRPELSSEEMRILERLIGGKLALTFKATVTDTGQVIECRPLSGIPSRTPQPIVEKLKDSVMRHTFQPYVISGKATAFTTTIVLELP